MDDRQRRHVHLTHQCCVRDSAGFALDTAAARGFCELHGCLRGALLCSSSNSVRHGLTVFRYFQGRREKECIRTRKLLYGYGAFGAMIPTTNSFSPHSPPVSLTLTPKLIMDSPFQRTTSCMGVSFK